MIVSQKFQGKVIGLENKAFVNGNGRDEYIHPSKYLKNADLYDAKMLAAPELDNLIDAGVPLPSQSDGRDGHKHDGVENWEYYETLFKIGDNFFKGVINIEKISRGLLFKDITKIEDVTQDIMDSYGKNPKFQFLRTSSMNSISKTNENVNRNSERKEQQFAIIRLSNPSPDEYHTWIRSAEEIKTFQETLTDPEWEGYDGITSEKIASIEAIPTVLNQGKVIFANTKSGTDVERIVVCAPISIGSTSYYMGVMLQRDSQNQRLYLHNVVIEQEMPTDTQANLVTTGADANSEHLSITRILQDALKIKSKYSLSKGQEATSSTQWSQSLSRTQYETGKFLI